MAPSTHVVIAFAALLAGVLIRRLRRRRPSSIDAQIVEQLRAMGSDVSKPHDIEFFMYFPAEAGARHVAEKLDGVGFTTTVSRSEHDDMSWLALAKRNMVPDVPALEQLSRTLTQLCRAENGVYDGWGAPAET